MIAFWLPKLKGTRVMVDESRPQSPYTRITQEQYEAAQIKAVEDSIDVVDDQPAARCGNAQPRVGLHTDGHTGIIVTLATPSRH